MSLAISRKRWVSKSNERESCGRNAVPGLSLTFLHCAMPKDKNEESGARSQEPGARSIHGGTRQSGRATVSKHGLKGLCCGGSRNAPRRSFQEYTCTNSCTTAPFTRLPLSLSGQGEMSRSYRIRTVILMNLSTFEAFPVHRSTAPPLHRSTAPPLHRSTTPSPSLHHSITPSLHHSITPSLHHSITPSLHHSITPSLHRSPS
jgi:hypothetical protein